MAHYVSFFSTYLGSIASNRDKSLQTRQERQIEGGGGKMKRRLQIEWQKEKMTEMGRKRAETVSCAGSSYWTDGHTAERGPRRRHYNARVKISPEKRKRAHTHTYPHTYTQWQRARSFFFPFITSICEPSRHSSGRLQGQHILSVRWFIEVFWADPS